MSDASRGPALYEVTVEVEPALAPALEQYMLEHHIPDIYATGCFRLIRFARNETGRFRTSYEAATQADLDRYLRDHTSRFRAELTARFPTGLRASREVWMVRGAWP